MDVGTLVTWLHQKAQRENRIMLHDTTADELLNALEHPATMREGDTFGISLATQLRYGMIYSREARTIRAVALKQLHHYDVCILAVEELGYSTFVLRALLTRHYTRLLQEEPQSVGSCVLLDIHTAVKFLTQEQQRCVHLLCAGYGPKRISETLKIPNGNRLIGRTLRGMSAYLEGERNER